MAEKVVVPEMGESVLEATVAAWFVKEGDYVKVGDVLLELETDKVNLEVGAQTAGVLAKITVQEGEDVQVGDVLGEIDPEAEQPEAEQLAAPEKAPSKEQVVAAAEEKQPQEQPAAERAGGLQITPVAARLAKEKGIDLSALSDKEDDGRITKADVERYLQQREAQSQRQENQAEARPSEPSRPAGQPASAGPRGEERQRMSRRRRTIARRLLEAQQTTAMLNTFNEIDMAAVMDLRKRRNPAFQERHGVKLGITSFFVKASISALKAFPRLNAEIQDDEIVLKHYYDIGMAIGAEEGLVVPVIRDADRLSFAQIEEQIKALVEKSNAGQLTIEDLTGGTFTITNGGVFGSLLSTPILNPPQVGILGLHKIEERPIAREGEVLVRPMMYVALSYDHRIVDGREAVQFLVHIKELLEDPERLLLEG
jgi:2-oxoglutarate dehydrogenase E2 component (dihydrolipoamide succinyltransferase)